MCISRRLARKGRFRSQVSKTEQADEKPINVFPWNPSAKDAADDFDRVIELHRGSKATLGHLPFSAFDEAGRRGNLILGEIDEVIQGYVLYNTPRHHTLKLVHVCVGPDARRTGLARRMVEFAIAANPDRSVVAAHCRADFGIDGFWRSLDMTPSFDRPGRALKGSTLTVWTRRIGPLDLLEEALYASSRPLAVLDSNVVLDLYTSSEVDRHDRDESLGLVEDWVSDQIEFSVSPEVDVDINSFEPASERRRVQQSLGALVPLRRAPSMPQLAEVIISRMPSALVKRDTSLSSDARHLADAINSGADYFVTRDQVLIDAVGDWLQKEHHLEVVRPVDLLQRLIPPMGLSPFRSDLLESVGLKWVPVASIDRELEELFLEHSSREKQVFMRKRLMSVLAKPGSASLDVLVDERGRRWALLGTEARGETLTVPVLRAGRASLGSTVAFQLVRHLRNLALSRSIPEVRITEQSLSPVLIAALAADGFEGSPLRAEIAKHPDSSKVASLQTPAEIAIYERRNWPQVILRREVPLWIVPIQPTYARELIGFNDTLIRSRERLSLGLSREFVYFASPRIKDWVVPGRVLWYVTKDRKAKEATAVRAVVAHSRLVDYDILEVSDAIEQYRSHGVLRAKEIERRANKGRVLVLRFEDTHVLPLAVGRSVLDPLLSEHGVRPPILTMRSVRPGLFDEILELQEGAGLQ